MKKKKVYVLVTQGLEIYRTTNRKEAEKFMNESNEEWYKYCQNCYDEGIIPADNQVFMYEE